MRRFPLLAVYLILYGSPDQRYLRSETTTGPLRGSRLFVELVAREQDHE